MCNPEIPFSGLVLQIGRYLVGYSYSSPTKLKSSKVWDRVTVTVEIQITAHIKDLRA